MFSQIALKKTEQEATEEYRRGNEVLEEDGVNPTKQQKQAWDPSPTPCLRCVVTAKDFVSMEPGHPSRIQQEQGLTNGNESPLRAPSEFHQQIADARNQKQLQDPLRGVGDVSHDTEATELLLEGLGFGRNERVIVSTGGKDGSGCRRSII